MSTLEQAVEEISLRTRTLRDLDDEDVMTIRVKLREGVRAEELHQQIKDTIEEHLGRRPDGVCFDNPPRHDHGEFYIDPLPGNAGVVLKMIAQVAGEYFEETRRIDHG